jgi:uncharacterized protein YndB with AHSA1/START domain
MVRAEAVWGREGGDRAYAGRHVQRRDVLASGEAFPEKPGCVLVVEPQRRLVWTDALGPLFRPNMEAFMTADITMEGVSGGTQYRALVRHKNPEDRARHEAMGFLEGWGTCLTQLEALAMQLSA